MGGKSKTKKEWATGRIVATVLAAICMLGLSWNLLKVETNSGSNLAIVQTGSKTELEVTVAEESYELHMFSLNDFAVSYDGQTYDASQVLVPEKYFFGEGASYYQLGPVVTSASQLTITEGDSITVIVTTDENWITVKSKPSPAFFAVTMGFTIVLVIAVYIIVGFLLNRADKVEFVTTPE